MGRCDPELGIRNTLLLRRMMKSTISQLAAATTGRSQERPLPQRQVREPGGLSFSREERLYQNCLLWHLPGGLRQIFGKSALSCLPLQCIRIS